MSPQDHSGPDPEDELQAAVESIGGHARSANIERASRLGQALVEAAAGRLDESRRQQAIDTAHQLVGSAGTFGFVKASQLAGEIEQYLVEADFADPGRLASVRDQVRRLRKELSKEPDYQPEEDREPTS